MPANQRLKHERLVRGWSQQDVAAAIGTTHVNVSRWERGITSPYPYLQRKLCELFEMDAVALGFVEENREITARAGGIYDPTIPLPLAAASPLVGRDQFITHLRQLLFTDSASIALNGLPGVGKTALAITLASDPSLRIQFPDGILWAALGPHPNVSEILSRWGALLGIAASGMGTLKNNEIWARTLREVIGTRRLLIVLDDLWTIEAATALKVGGSHCAYLATTRFPHIAASFAMKGAIKVSELSEEEGVALLHHLAPEIATYDADMIRALVRSVGALPLALTLIGKHLYIQMYTEQPRRFRLAIERLHQAEHRLQLSEPASPPDISTHLPAVSLQAVIATSDEHLDERARQTLRTLSLFPAKPNTFSEEAALAVSNVPVEGLDILIDAGLLEINGTGRYTLHQAIADYARLQQNSENVFRRFVEYYTTYIEERRATIEALELESQNLFSALEMADFLGDHPLFVQMVFALTDFLLYRGLYEKALSLLTRAYEVTKTSDDFRAIATCLHHLGMVEQKRGEYQQATEHYEAGFALARKAGISEWIGEFLSALGWVAAKRGLYDRAQVYAQEGLSLVDQINDAHRCKLLTVLGVIADNTGEFVQAEEYYQEGLTLAQRNNDKEQQCIILNNLGVNASERGMWKEAVAFLQDVQRLAIQLNHLEWQCLALLNLCVYYIVTEDYDLAGQWNNEALLLTKQLGQREWECFSFLTQGVLALKKKNYAQADTSLQEALVLASEIEKPHYICDALKFLGDLALECQRIEDAAHFYAQMKQVIPQGHQGLKAENFYRLGLVAAAKQETQEAEKLGKAALTIFQEIGHRTTDEVFHWLETGCPRSLPHSV